MMGLYLKYALAKGGIPYFDKLAEHIGDRVMVICRVMYAKNMKKVSERKFGFTLYLEDDASTKEGFRIATVIAGHDTEMLMNMAEREQLSDTYTCPKIGNWSEAVTHTIMQP